LKHFIFCGVDLHLGSRQPLGEAKSCFLAGEPIAKISLNS
jgi:hypothetical protein